MEYSNETLRAIFESDSNGKLVLPNFQRDFVWTREKQSKLLASVLVGLPIGSVLIVEGSKDDFSSRRLGFTNSTEPKEECRFLLDGQQRLSCLKSIFDDLFPSDSWKSKWDTLYGLLRNRWFLKIEPPNEGLDDIWGWEKLKFIDELHKYDPDQVQDFLVFHRILVKGETDPNAWHHPAHKVSNSSGEEVTIYAQRRELLTQKFTAEGVIPLFEIYSNTTSDSLHNKTLRKIASKRREMLKAKVKDGEFSLEDILGHINPNVASVTDSTELETLWFELASTWASEVRSALEKLLEQKVIETILPYNEIERAASIFETINEGGTPLSNFDLIVAKTAIIGVESSSLSQTFKNSINEEIQIPDSICTSLQSWKLDYMQAIKENSISRVVTDQFLNLVSILSYETELPKKINDIKIEHIKQAKILRLKREKISSNLNRAIKSLIKAFAFLQYRCGIVYINDLSYKLMILPIAYLFSLEEPIATETTESISIASVWNDKKRIDKIEYWYWSSLFSGRYKEKQNERCIEDIKSLYSWVISDSENPFEAFSNNVFDKNEYSDEAVLLLNNEDFLPPAAIKNGILQYVLSKEPKDFLFSVNSNTNSISKLKAWKIAQNNEKIEEHHIIPLGSVTTIGEDSTTIRNNSRHLLNSPLNLTYISKEANRKITDLDAESYLTFLTDATVTGHEISPNMIDLLKKRPPKYEDVFYKQIFQDRFNTIKRSLKTELESLIDGD